MKVSRLKSINLSNILGLVLVLTALGPRAWTNEDDDFLDGKTLPSTPSITEQESTKKSSTDESRNTVKTVDTKKDLENQILVAEKKFEKDKSSVQKRISLAQLYSRIEAYEKVINTLDPYSAELSSTGLILLAKSYEQTKDYFNEIRILKIVVAKNPNSHSAHLRLAKAYLNDEKEKNDKEAVDSLRQAIKLKPKLEEAFLILLDVFKRQKNNYESLVIVKDLVKQFGMNPKYASELCHVYTAAAYLQEAIKYCLQAITADPNNPDNHGHLARCYLDKGEKETSERILKTAAKRFSNSASIQTQAGKYYFDQKNYGVAERYFTQGVKADINSLDAQLGMARSSFELGRFAKALEGYKNACRLNKESLKYIRESVTALRLNKNYIWESKYNSVLFGCRS